MGKHSVLNIWTKQTLQNTWYLKWLADRKYSYKTNVFFLTFRPEHHFTPDVFLTNNVAKHRAVWFFNGNNSKTTFLLRICSADQDKTNRFVNSSTENHDETNGFRFAVPKKTIKKTPIFGSCEQCSVFSAMKNHVATWPAVNLFGAGPDRWHGRKAVSITYLKTRPPLRFASEQSTLHCGCPEFSVSSLCSTCPQATHIVHDLRDGTHHPAVASDGVTICQRVSRSKHWVWQKKRSNFFVEAGLSARESDHHLSRVFFPQWHSRLHERQDATFDLVEPNAATVFSCAHYTSAWSLHNIFEMSHQGVTGFWVESR